MRFALPILALVAPGCTPDSKPAPPPALVAPAPPPIAPVPSALPAGHKGFGDVAFACCANEPARLVVESYLDVTAKLVGGETKAVALAFQGLAERSSEAAKATGVDAAAATQLTSIAGAAKSLGDMDVAGARKEFGALSASVIAFARAQTGGEQKIAEVYCPMVKASWLTAEPKIENPYYGKDMLNCGSFR